MSLRTINKFPDIWHWSLHWGYSLINEVGQWFYQLGNMNFSKNVLRSVYCHSFYSNLLFCLGRGCRDFRDSSYVFHFMTLIWLTIYVQTERCCITCYCSFMFSAKFILLIVFIFQIVFYFINSFLKVYRSEHKWVSKFLKSAMFLSLLSWIIRRKCRKNMVLRWSS